MVREFGLSASVGPGRLPDRRVGVPRRGRRRECLSRPFAEATQAAIDNEVARLLREAEEQATSLISAHRGDLHKLTNLLLDKETVDGEAIYQLVGRPVPDRRDGQEIAPRAAAAAVADGKVHEPPSAG